MGSNDNRVLDNNVQDAVQYEETLNAFARHSWIRRMLAEIVVDMTIAKEIRHTDPMEFPMMLKSEIDKIVEQWKQKELVRDASGNTADTTARSTIAKSMEGPA